MLTGRLFAESFTSIVVGVENTIQSPNLIEALLRLTTYKVIVDPVT